MMSPAKHTLVSACHTGRSFHAPKGIYWHTATSLPVAVYSIKCMLVTAPATSQHAFGPTTHFYRAMGANDFISLFRERPFL